MSSISPSLGDISSQLLLPPRLSMSGGGGDLLLECFGSGSPSNVGAVTTGKVPKEALLNRSWLGACCFQLCPEPAWEREVPESCPGWAPACAGTNPRRSIRSPSGRLGVTGVRGGLWHLLERDSAPLYRAGLPEGSRGAIGGKVPGKAFCFSSNESLHKQ